MSAKLAVAIVHGIGRPDTAFANGMIKDLEERFAQATGAHADLICEPVWWAGEMQRREDILWERVNADGKLDFQLLRRFLIDFAADAVAYQPTPGDRRMYDNVHVAVARAFKRLAERAGPEAPLVVVAHSLGTVIMSNYLYDLQVEFEHRSAIRGEPARRILSDEVRTAIGLHATPLERGETLSHFFTLGSPIVMWALRHMGKDPAHDFGVPIRVPSARLSEHQPRLHARGAGLGWTNIYDVDDIIGYPLRTLNTAYGIAVREDRRVNVGGLFTNWNPASHTGYWTDADVTKPIAEALSETWKVLAAPSAEAPKRP